MTQAFRERMTIGRVLLLSGYRINLILALVVVLLRESLLLCLHPLLVVRLRSFALLELERPSVDDESSISLSKSQRYVSVEDMIPYSPDLDDKT